MADELCTLLETKCSLDETLTVSEFFERLKNQNKDEFQTLMKQILEEQGTALHCNRFAVGNCHEYAISELIQSMGLETEVESNAKRIDISVKNFRKFSIKYSSGGNIKLHNSNNTSNTDYSMVDTLLVTPTEWWFLVPNEIAKQDIDLKEFLKSTGDGLQLMSRILTVLHTKKYPYHFACDIRVDKKKCKNLEINRIVYESIKKTLSSLPSETKPSS